MTHISFVSALLKRQRPRQSRLSESSTSSQPTIGRSFDRRTFKRHTASRRCLRWRKKKKKKKKTSLENYPSGERIINCVSMDRELDSIDAPIPRASRLRLFIKKKSSRVVVFPSHAAGENANANAMRPPPRCIIVGKVGTGVDHGATGVAKRSSVGSRLRVIPHHSRNAG